MSLWRPPYAHLSKEDRAKLVRDCKGKDVYESPAEAYAAAETMTLRPGYYISVYECPLCGGIHIGNRKYLTWDSLSELAKQRREVEIAKAS